MQQEIKEVPDERPRLLRKAWARAERVPLREVIDLIDRSDETS